MYMHKHMYGIILYDLSRVMPTSALKPCEVFSWQGHLVCSRGCPHLEGTARSARTQTSNWGSGFEVAFGLLFGVFAFCVV